MIDVAELRGSVTGPVLQPGDDGYAADVVPNKLNNPLVPAAAVGVTSVADVQAVVRFAQWAVLAPLLPVAPARGRPPK
jgi:hypothetical protein